MQRLVKYLAASLLAVSSVSGEIETVAPTEKTGEDALVSGFGKSPYLVIDLSEGSAATVYPVRYEPKGPDIDFDTCRTKEMWLRLVPSGRFIMGCPSDEIGRRGGMDDLHEETIAEPFYIGMFEVTQSQYELVTGWNPSKHKGLTRPVESVSYDTLRGASDDMDESSFFGILRKKTALFADLPSEVQWEYACRAGTRTALNSGKELTNQRQCPNMAEVGRYKYNQSDNKSEDDPAHERRPGPAQPTPDNKGGYPSKHTKVGMYRPNAWGLYDMHGNVWEWCLLESSGNTTGNTMNQRPTVPRSQAQPLLRGGSYDEDAAACRSANRTCLRPHLSRTIDSAFGFRVVVLPGTPPQKPLQDDTQKQPDSTQRPPLPIQLIPAPTNRLITAVSAPPTGQRSLTTAFTFESPNRLREIGSPSSMQYPCLGDEITINWKSPEDPKPQPDSTWVIEKAEVWESPFQMKNGRGLKSDGKFVFLYYTVKNTTRMEIPQFFAPVLMDSSDNRFFPRIIPPMDEFPIPNRSLFREGLGNKIFPGGSKSFCSIYEVPLDSTFKYVDIYPANLTRHLSSSSVRQFTIKGKNVELAEKASVRTPSPQVTSGEKVTVFMTCKQQSGTATAGRYTTIRTLTCNVDLRLTSPSEKSLNLKAYFIATEGSREVVFDVSDEEILLQPGKTQSFTVQSKDIQRISYSLSENLAPKGTIIQLWAETGIVQSWSSQQQWGQLAKDPNIEKKIRFVRANNQR